MDEHIITELKDLVLRIEINRPKKKNALTSSMKDSIAEAIWRGENNPKIHVILINGQKDFFSTGVDINTFNEILPNKDVPWPDHLTMFRTAKKPLIAAVSGYAIGAGMTLLLHCDLVYAAENAKFRLPFTDLGVCPENGSSFLLPYLIGYYRASELLLFGEFFDAKKAYELGFVNALFPTDQLLDNTMILAKKLAEKPPKSVQATKYLMKRNTEIQLKKAIDLENKYFSERVKSSEHIKAIEAFFKRK